MQPSVPSRVWRSLERQDGGCGKHHKRQHDKAYKQLVQLLDFVSNRSFVRFMAPNLEQLLSFVKSHLF